MDERESMRIETINVPLSAAQREALARPEHAHVGPLLERMFRVKLAKAASPCKLCGGVGRDQRCGVCDRCAFPHGGAKTASMRAALSDARLEREQLRHDYLGACSTIEAMHRAATGRFGEAPQRGVVEDVRDVADELERTRVQLAGCDVAAHGGTSKAVVAKRDAYGWSPTYQAVLDLRRKYDALCSASKHTKTAARHTMPNYGGSSFSYANKQEMVAGSLRQRPIRAILGMVPKEQRRAAVKELHKQMRGMAAGTIAYNPTQKRSINLVDRDWFKGNSRAKRRMVLAHEAFHSRTPVLGTSEIAAHMYGGWKANKGVKRVWSGDGTGAINQLGHLAQTRPERLGIELALLAGAGYAGYRGYKALRAKLRDKDQDRKKEVAP